jgi:hypothetical protein
MNLFLMSQQKRESMKKLFAILCGSIFLMSCGTEMSLVKRHYRSGYYFASSTKSTNVLEHKESVVDGSTVSPVQASHTIKTESPVTAAVKKPGQEVKGPVASSHLEPALAKQKISPFKPAFLAAKGIQPGVQKEKTFFIPKKAGKKESKKAASKEIDGMTILMIILCLFPFINLIPVYLHDKDLTMNFLLTLLLDLLFFIPGIIFSILVVLDIVDLA